MYLNFSEDYVLENERVRLEPLKLAHYRALDEWAKEPEIWTYFLGRSNGQKNFLAYLEDAISSRSSEKEYAFAVYDKSVSKYVGCTRLFDYDQELAIVRLGYTWYGKQCWGSGLNQNCKYLLFQFAFEDLGLERVGLGAHSENQRSISAMKSVGCLQEGTVRNAFPGIESSGRANAVLLGILKNEWFETVKQTLKQKL